MSVPNVFVRHPVFGCLTPVDAEDGVVLRSAGIKVGSAVPILYKYAQPGSGLFITDEHGVPRNLDEPLWTVQDADTLYYRMETLDINAACQAQEILSKQYMEESDYPQILGVGYLVRADQLDRKAHYFLLSIDLDKRFYPDTVIGDTLERPPDGLPSFFRNLDRTYCIPIEYCISSMMHAF